MIHTIKQWLLSSLALACAASVITLVLYLQDITLRYGAAGAWTFTLAFAIYGLFKHRDQPKVAPWFNRFIGLGSLLLVSMLASFSGASALSWLMLFAAGAALLTDFSMWLVLRLPAPFTWFSIAQNTCLELRRKHISSCVSAFMVAVLMLVLYLAENEARADYRMQLLISWGHMVIVAISSIPLLTMAAYTTWRDLHYKHVFIDLVKPVSRPQWLIGKWSGLLIMAAIWMGLGYSTLVGLVAWAPTRYIQEQVHAAQAGQLRETVEQATLTAQMDAEKAIENAWTTRSHLLPAEQSSNQVVKTLYFLQQLDVAINSGLQLTLSANQLRSQAKANPEDVPMESFKEVLSANAYRDISNRALGAWHALGEESTGATSNEPERIFHFDGLKEDRAYYEKQRLELQERLLEAGITEQEAGLILTWALGLEGGDSSALQKMSDDQRNDFLSALNLWRNKHIVLGIKIAALGETQGLGYNEIPLLAQYGIVHISCNDKPLPPQTIPGMDRGSLPGIRYLALEQESNLKIPLWMIDEQGIAEIRLRRVGGPRISQPTFIMTPDQDLTLKVGQSTLPLNTLKLFYISLCRCAFLISLGIIAGSFLGFPVAILFSISIFVVVSAAHYFAGALEDFVPMTRPEDTPLIKTLIMAAMRYVGNALLWALPSPDQSLAKAYADSITINFKTIWKATWQLGIIWGVGFLGVGILAFFRREIGKPTTD